MNERQTAADLQRLGATVREARRRRRATLEGLAAASGVSKSVLSQVERGATNPTLSTLWNIATALALDPAQLFGGNRPNKRAAERRESLIEVIAEPVIENEPHRFRLVILSKPELAGVTELYRLQLGAGGALESRPHESGTTEQVTVLHGKVEIRSGDSIATLKAGQSARYSGDVPHAIAERAGKSADILLFVMFSR